MHGVRALSSRKLYIEHVAASAWHAVLFQEMVHGVGAWIEYDCNFGLDWVVSDAERFCVR